MAESSPFKPAIIKVDNTTTSIDWGTPSTIISERPRIMPVIESASIYNKILADLKKRQWVDNDTYTRFFGLILASIDLQLYRKYRSNICIDANTMLWGDPNPADGKTQIKYVVNDLVLKDPPPKIRPNPYGNFASEQAVQHSWVDTYRFAKEYDIVLSTPFHTVTNNGTDIDTFKSWWDLTQGDRTEIGEGDYPLYPGASETYRQKLATLSTNAVQKWAFSIKKAWMWINALVKFNPIIFLPLLKYPADPVKDLAQVIAVDGEDDMVWRVYSAQATKKEWNTRIIKYNQYIASQQGAPPNNQMNFTDNNIMPARMAVLQTKRQPNFMQFASQLENAPIICQLIYPSLSLLIKIKTMYKNIAASGDPVPVLDFSNSQISLTSEPATKYDVLQFDDKGQITSPVDAKLVPPELMLCTKYSKVTINQEIVHQFKFIAPILKHYNNQNTGRYYPYTITINVSDDEFQNKKNQIFWIMGCNLPNINQKGSIYGIQLKQTPDKKPIGNDRNPNILPDPNLPLPRPEGSSSTANSSSSSIASACNNYTYAQLSFTGLDIYTGDSELDSYLLGDLFANDVVFGVSCINGTCTNGLSLTSDESGMWRVSTFFSNIAIYYIDIILSSECSDGNITNSTFELVISSELGTIFHISTTSPFNGTSTSGLIVNTFNGSVSNLSIEYI
jgi:hypothetical protein